MTFYVIATIFCLLTIAVSIWNAVEATDFIHGYLTKPDPDGDTKRRDFSINLLISLDSSVSIMLLLTIVYMMYKLNTSIMLILSDNENTQQLLEISRRKEKGLLVTCIVVVTISMIVSIVTAVFVTYYCENKKAYVVANIVESGYELLCLCFLANIYTWTIF